MENSHQKLSSKSIRKFGKDIWEFIVYRTKLYFLPLTIPFKLTNRKKEKMYFLMDKNYHYGFVIETIVLKLQIMKDSWPEYKFNEREIETLDILISEGSELLDILQDEDAENHIRTKKYLDKQKYFFNMLNVKLPELFY